MRKLIILTAMVAIAATAVVWSITTVARPKFCRESRRSIGADLAP